MIRSTCCGENLVVQNVGIGICPLSINESVGKGGRNNKADVDTVRNLLIRHRQWVGFDLRTTKTMQVSNIFISAIIAFQKSACSILNPDGRVDPGGFTIKRLTMAMITKPKHKVFQNTCWNPGADLTDADYSEAAKTLACEKEAIQAVATVETKRKASDSLGRPTILYERHKFRDFTSGAYNQSHSDISGPLGGHGRFSEQYGKLYRAAVLNETAALKSCSWGAFQIMGFNHSIVGYRTVDAFVDAMIGSQSNQLRAFVSFVSANASMRKAIQDKDWSTFARLYNGSKYTKNSYDIKMESEYNRLISARN